MIRTATLGIASLFGSLWQIGRAQPTNTPPQSVTNAPPPGGGDHRFNNPPRNYGPDEPARLIKLGSRGINVHDPSTMVKCKDEFWIFYTGPGTPSWHSKDMVTWERGPKTFTETPAWVREAVPAFRGSNFWAPDIMRVGDQYLLFYAASSFGRNGSAIGVASNPTLDPADPAYKWTDGGLVVKSTSQDDFNTIDPAIARDASGGLWLSFGSFWSGIKLIELDPKTGKRIAPDSPMYSLAHHSSIEAPFIYLHDGQYYLFVNWGYCCRGANSTYEIRVGRSAKITGPYLDKDGRDLLVGGGTKLLGTDGAFIGPGHAGIIEDNGKFWFGCHFYDGTSNPRGTYAVRELTWDAQGWPVVGMGHD